ncbi:MAG: hypothetical protein R3B47_19275 [Bacteroidia bacterium]
MHKAGGTNPSLVEAMALGLPVFAYDVVFNKRTTLHDARYFDDSYSLRMILGLFLPASYINGRSACRASRSNDIPGGQSPIAMPTYLELEAPQQSWQLPKTA